MSIASEISRISGNVADAYTAANAKGATMPVSQNSDNLATTISTIQTGTTPTGTKSITANGVYDVTNYAAADVQVPTTAPAHYVEKIVDANSKLVNGSNIINLSGVTDIGANVLNSAYKDSSFPSNTSIDFSSLTTLSGRSCCQSMFGNCTGLTSMDLSSLTTINGQSACGYMFQNCTGLTTVNLSSLTTINAQSACQYMFSGATGLTTVNLSSLTTINGQYACQYMFSGATGLINIDLSSLVTINDYAGCQYMFENCTGLTTVDLSSLTTINGQSACDYMFTGCTNLISVELSSSLTNLYNCAYMFNGCRNLTSINLSSVEQIESAANMFDGCGSLTSINLSSLKKAGVSACRYMFRNCTGLTTVNLSSLTTIPYNSVFQYAFQNCTSLTNISFYALTPTSFGTITNQFNGMLSGVTGCTVHFPMAIQSTIGSWTSVTGGFSGTNTTVLFDIVTSLTGADSNTYTRKQKDSTSTATAWEYNSTVYYTSGTTEPAVNDTIYSDSACTTAVTTISSIA